ncbi:SpoIIE family protein phosphatase [Streptomyces sp. LARHCF252]
MDPEAVFPLTEIPLTPGLMLAFYTDGLIETPGTGLDDSIAGLAHHLAQADEGDLDLLIDHLLRTAGTDGQRADDIALLVLHNDVA